MSKPTQIIIGIAIAFLLFFVFFNKKDTEKSLENGEEKCEGCNNNVEQQPSEIAEDLAKTDVDESAFLQYAATGVPSILGLQI